MHLNARKPVLMPARFWREFEALSKAALLDLVWDLAVRQVGEEAGEEAAVAWLREQADIIKWARRPSSVTGAAIKWRRRPKGDMP